MLFFEAIVFAYSMFVFKSPSTCISLSGSIPTHFILHYYRHRETGLSIIKRDERIMQGTNYFQRIKLYDIYIFTDPE